MNKTYKLNDWMSQHKYTEVHRVMNNDADPSLYIICANNKNANGSPVWQHELHFQNGPILEAGVNGIMDENLLAVVRDRLKVFQQTKFACRENDLAITAIEEALLWLRKRTSERELRGVEGTNNV